MEKFCGKCGAKLDETTGKCPKCDIKRQKRKRIKKRFAMFLILLVFMLTALTILTYLDIMDVPFFKSSTENIGTKSYEELEDEFHILSENYTDKRVLSEASAIEAAKDAAEVLELGNSADELTVLRVSEVGETTYYRLQQNYKGIPVYGRTMIVAANQEGNAVGFSTNAMEIDGKISENPSIDEENLQPIVIASISEFVGGDKVEIIAMTSLEDDALVFYYIEAKDRYCLSYDIQVVSDAGAFHVIADAETGDVLFIESAINYSQREFTYPGQVKSQTFMAEQTDTENQMVYVGENGTRISVFTPIEKYTWYQDGNANLVGWADNEPDSSAVDALKNLQDVYCFYQKQLDWDGLDNLGTDVRAYVHVEGYDMWSEEEKKRVEKEYVNNAAHWNSPNGQVLMFSRCYEGGNLKEEYSSELNVVGHEYTHGVERNISAMDYVDESGAIMEAYSDVFGEFVEAYYNGGKCDWENSVRNIEDPLRRKCPIKYDGKQWRDKSKVKNEIVVHDNSTVISHAAYLMSADSGSNGLSKKELMQLWFQTLHSLPANCTFMVLRENMEMTADIMGFSKEQKQFISSAFDEVGVKSQESETETYSVETTLSVIDKNGELYDDYTVLISGKEHSGWFWKKDYKKEITVVDREPLTLEIPKGDYVIKVTDNFNQSLEAEKNIKIRKGGKQKNLLIATEFGFDYIIRSDAKLSVLDMNKLLYDNYSVKIAGTYQNAEGKKTSYNDQFTVDSCETDLKLPEGKYSFLLTDGMDSKKTKSFTVKVQSLGIGKVRIVTAFGKKAGTFAPENVPTDAEEFNGHYYYVFKDEQGWNQAKEFCENHQGYLATITTLEEQQFVQEYLAQVTANAAITNERDEVLSWNKEVWIGATDSSFEGEWEWSNKECFKYTNWGESQPDDAWGQDYGAMYTYLQGDEGYQIEIGEWDDLSSGSRPFLCEWGEYIPESAEKEMEDIPKRKTSEERDIVLVLDTSGSMEGTKIDETKKAAVKFVETVLKEDASIGIITYEEAANLVSDFSIDEKGLKEKVETLDAGGGTNIESGLQTAYDLLDYSNAKKKMIILMSDGEPNHGKVGKELVDFANEIKDEGILIYTLGFFQDLEENKSSAQLLMEQIASEGCHYEVASAEELKYFFGDVADKIKGQKYIYVRIACPVDVSVSYDGEILNSAESRLNTRTNFGTLSFEQSSEESERDDRIKVLRLKEGTDYDIEIVGTGRGMMNYTIGFMDENGDYSDFRTFRNIRITKQTEIDSVAKVSDETILRIDEDGDGKYDRKLRAKENGFGEEVNSLVWVYNAVGSALGAIVLGLMAVNRRKKKKGMVN